MNGMKVELTLVNRDGNKVKSVLHNVTEVHYRYKSALGEKRVAFESDIHTTGVTYGLEGLSKWSDNVVFGVEYHVVEFEVFPEKEMHPEFWVPVNR